MAPATFWHAFKKGPLKVSIIGSGNWGSAISTIVGTNAAASYIFADEVLLWVLDEDFEGTSLIDCVNLRHENPKYLPNVKLPENIKATGDIMEAGAYGDLLVFVLPHQFVVPNCKLLAKVVKPHAKAISLVKGLHIEDGLPYLFSDLVRDTLGIDCCVLSGANVATDVARQQFSETTIGYTDKEIASIWQQLFDTPSFRVNGIPDVRGVEVCGAVKNVVALSAGFCDGLELGSNSKAAIMRIGVEEMKLFAILFFDGILEETFFESAGFADVVTTCYGGRNVRCAAEFVRRKGSSWDDIERDLLKGQKMQGHLTCKEVYSVISANNLEELFPLFSVTYKVAFQGLDAKKMVEVFMSDITRPLTKREECSGCVLPDAVVAARGRIASTTSPRRAGVSKSSSPSVNQRLKP